MRRLIVVDLDRGMATSIQIFFSLRDERESTSRLRKTFLVPDSSGRLLRRSPRRLILRERANERGRERTCVSFDIIADRNLPSNVA